MEKKYYAQWGILTIEHKEVDIQCFKLGIKDTLSDGYDIILYFEDTIRYIHLTDEDIKSFIPYIENICCAKDKEEVDSIFMIYKLTGNNILHILNIDK